MPEELKKLKISAELNSNSMAGCLNAAGQLKNYLAKQKSETKKAAILSNFTIKGLPEALITKSFLHDIFIDVYEGDYGQWRQEIMGEKLYQFNPDVVFIVLDAFGIDHDIHCSYHILGKNEVDKIFDDYLKELRSYINAIKEKSRAKIIVSNIPNHWLKILGIIDHKFETSIRRAVANANITLENSYLNDAQVLIFDFDGWLGHIGKEKYLCDKYFFLADMRLSPEAVPLLAEELVSYLIPISAKSKKCLVLDLDDTLWGGIIGEDGLGGIALSPSGKGQPFYLFQKLLLGFYKRGVILCVNSKNNPDDALEVFSKHPHSILKENHFAASRINWQDKITNLKELAEEINIGLDSMVFIDDDPANRAMVKEFLPEVAVIDLPKDPALYCKTLLSYKGLQRLEYTDEDKKRGEGYFRQRQRKILQGQKPDLSSFLRSLELKIKIEPVSDITLPRSAQMTQKTNQFNLTTRRYQEEDIKNFLNNGDKIWTLSAADKFGDYGTVGLAIIKDQKDHWLIDSFLLSCRILGKKVEEQFLNFILDELKNIEVKPVIGQYFPTNKNMQVKTFYSQMGFSKTKIKSNFQKFL